MRILSIGEFVKECRKYNCNYFSFSTKNNERRFSKERDSFGITMHYTEVEETPYGNLCFKRGEDTLYFYGVKEIRLLCEFAELFTAFKIVCDPAKSGKETGYYMLGFCNWTHE